MRQTRRGGFDQRSAVGESLVQDVYDRVHRPDDNNIWVFDRGQWYQGEGLAKAVESAGWDRVFSPKTCKGTRPLSFRARKYTIP